MQKYQSIPVILATAIKSILYFFQNIGHYLGRLPEHFDDYCYCKLLVSDAISLTLKYRSCYFDKIFFNGSTVFETSSGVSDENDIEMTTFLLQRNRLLSQWSNQRPVMRIFGVFFDLRLNKRLRKQPRCHRSHNDVTETCYLRCEVNWYLNICTAITHYLYLIHMRICYQEFSSTHKILSVILKNVVWSTKTYSKPLKNRQSKFENIIDSVFHRMIMYYVSCLYTTHWLLKDVVVIVRVQLM